MNTKHIAKIINENIRINNGLITEAHEYNGNCVVVLKLYGEQTPEQTPEPELFLPDEDQFEYSVERIERQARPALTIHCHKVIINNNIIYICTRLPKPIKEVSKVRTKRNNTFQLGLVTIAGYTKTRFRAAVENSEFAEIIMAAREEVICPICKKFATEQGLIKPTKLEPEEPKTIKPEQLPDEDVWNRGPHSQFHSSNTIWLRPYDIKTTRLELVNNIIINGKKIYGE